MRPFRLVGNTPQALLAVPTYVWPLQALLPAPQSCGAVGGSGGAREAECWTGGLLCAACLPVHLVDVGALLCMLMLDWALVIPIMNGLTHFVFHLLNALLRMG